MCQGRGDGSLPRQPKGHDREVPLQPSLVQLELTTVMFFKSYF